MTRPEDIPEDAPLMGKEQFLQTYVLNLAARTDGPMGENAAIMAARAWERIKVFCPPSAKP